MKNIKRKGFTLVELLIVIVVIGILSSMMMMSSTEATTSARASNIVSNLRNLKTAALAYYTDNLDKVTAAPNAAMANRTSHDAIFKYLGATAVPDSDDYVFQATAAGEWYVTYTIDAAKGITGTEKSGIKTKLAGRASSVGLCNGGSAATDSATGASPASRDVYKNTMGIVAMFIR